MISATIVYCASMTTHFLIFCERIANFRTFQVDLTEWMTLHVLNKVVSNGRS